ncbi:MULTISPECIES: hypothetical protein [unclassified Rhodococcus (in: high G+C Gram-positive bacteria)]|uniref:hypothetical protein n=1 Tax=unclassified Rhodococcus (in: high G+C Gram-positive bacteria) TaxID=192944 RepID=UPI00117B26FE|nr:MULTISPECIES: hypothetical protein [unclassified Rhodococcus (in: high G+C Gram-positive bacteria)]
MDTVVILGTVGAVAAAIFGAPAFIREVAAWLRRPEPFSLSERKPSGVAVLTRTGGKPVQLQAAWVFNHGQIPCTDARVDADWRVMHRGDFLVLDVNDVVPGDHLLVDFREISGDEVKEIEQSTQSRRLRQRLEIEREERTYERWSHAVL